MIKTEREIELLRRAVRIGDIGHQALAELVREAGRDEFAIWAELTSRMYRAAGHEIPIVGELVTGPRTCVVAYPAGPRARVTEPGDGALMDISQRIDGYWSDCTNTHIVGGVTPSAEQTRYARASQAACEAAMDALRPGNRASDAWNAAEAAFQRHGLTSAHYAGHQIGVGSQRAAAPGGVRPYADRGRHGRLRSSRACTRGQAEHSARDPRRWCW